MRPVPVLMYHHISPHKKDMVTVTPEVFEKQMEHLCKSGYKTLTLDELLSYINGDLIPEQRAVAVTFDDGWLDNYIYAFPVIEKYKIHASIFIITGKTEKASENQAQIPFQVPTHKESKLMIEKGREQRVLLNWELIKKMSATGLVAFYSHTKSHKKCSALPETELSEELRESKQALEKKLGKDCPYLCWPYGDYNNVAVKVAKDAGYKALFTIEHGVVKKGDDPFAVKRIVVKDNEAWFKNRMTVYTNSILSGLYLKIKKK
ncbi:MAG: hypothetical protein EPN94_06060 [Nitrospirae bacterium]|nr:MAG: hypothetical protein EPN94_06060 [Nitrospirota bacterium]